MMATAGVEVPDEFVALLEARRSLWSDYHTAQSVARNLDTLAQQVPTTGPTATLTETGGTSDPPTALRAALRDLEQDLREIGNLGNRIQGSRAEIAEILRHASQMKILLIGIGVAVVFVLGIIISQTL